MLTSNHGDRTIVQKNQKTTNAEVSSAKKYGTENGELGKSNERTSENGGFHEASKHAEESATISSRKRRYSERERLRIKTRVSGWVNKWRHKG